MNIPKKLHRTTDYLYAIVQGLYLRIPYHIPLLARQFIAAYTWIFAAAAGIIQLLFAIAFLDAGRRAEEAAQATTYLSRVYGAPAAVATPDFFFYATVIAMCLVGILILLALPGLRRHNRQRGWNILFYASLFHVIYGVCRIFSEIDGGVLHGLVAFVFSFAGIFVLFEIVPYFQKKTIQKEDA